MALSESPVSVDLKEFLGAKAFAATEAAKGELYQLVAHSRSLVDLSDQIETRSDVLKQAANVNRILQRNARSRRFNPRGEVPHGDGISESYDVVSFRNDSTVKTQSVVDFALTDKKRKKYQDILGTHVARANSISEDLSSRGLGLKKWKVRFSQQKRG